MPIMRMKADLYFVAGPTETWATSEAGEAAKKYAELEIDGLKPKLYLLEKAAMYQADGLGLLPCVQVTPSELMLLMAGVITGRSPSVIKEGPSPVLAAPVVPPIRIPPPQHWTTHEMCAQAVAGRTLLTSVGKSKNSGQVLYREINVEIMKAIGSGVMSRRQLVSELEPDIKWPLKEHEQEILDNLVGLHLYYLVEKKAVERVSRGKYRATKRGADEMAAYKSDPESERRVHEDTMAGAH